MKIAYDSFVQKFLSLPSDSIPTSEVLRKEALIAESIRLCILEYQSFSGRTQAVPLTHVTNWVSRKLRTVIPELSENRKLIRDILSESPGFNLELLGEVCFVENGIFGAPTRLVALKEDTWALISGLPTICFQDLNLKIVSHGIVRHLICPDERIDESALPTQSLGSYLGLHTQAQSSESIIESILRKNESNRWAPEAGYLAYMGATNGTMEKTGPFGFQAWGNKALEVPFPEGKVSLWKVERQWNAEYFLVITKPIKKARLEISNNYGHREAWVMYDNLMVKLNRSLLKRVCLELEAKSGKERQIIIEENENNITMKLGFLPPELFLRYIFVIGAEFRGKIDGNLTWNLPYGITEEIIELAKRLSLKTIFNIRQGSKWSQ